MAGNRTVETLTAARKRIETPERWTKRSFARDAYGVSESMTSHKAVCWCAEGSMIIESVTDKGWILFKDAADCSHIPDFNDADERTHAEVIAAFDAAIEKARAQ
jgi:hypothetical protein